MADNSVSVTVRGLKELRAGLKQIDAAAPKKLSKALGKIAEGIASKIRSVMPHRSGWAAGTVKAHGKATGASISIGTGDPAVDYVPWLDFGGSVGRNKSVRRNFIKQGRYLYPQIAAAHAQTVIAVEEAIGEAARAAGFTVTHV